MLSSQLEHLQNNYNNTLQAIGYLEKKYSGSNSTKNFELIPKQLFKSLSIVKFRRCVIAVTFVNRLRGVASKGGQGTEYGLIKKMGEGLSNLRATINRNISQENVDEILNHDDLRSGLIRIFNSKDYFNKTLFELESHIETNSQ